ncbi:MAG: Spy/CpxP family protein refolding chaperone [Muribaculaceae bacterium]|nr:Spy/CpxP family protein refolding chaperone [Muribaculaceae bacterium]
MKKIVLVLITALMGAFVTNAQPARHHGNPEQMMKERIERLSKALDLTDAQNAEIAKIYSQEMEAMAKERPEKPGQGERPDEAMMKAHHEKMKAQREATDAKIEALLTPEQAAKYAEMKNNEGKRGHGKKHGGPRHEGARPECGHDGCCKDSK